MEPPRPPPEGAAEWRCDFCLKMCPGRLEICPHCNPHLFEGPPGPMRGPPIRGGMHRGPRPYGALPGAARRGPPGGIGDHPMRQAGGFGDGPRMGGHPGMHGPMGGPGGAYPPMRGAMGGMRGGMGRGGGSRMDRFDQVRDGIGQHRGMLGPLRGNEFGHPERFDPFQMNPMMNPMVDGPMNLQNSVPLPLPEKNKLSEQARRVKEYREKIQREKEEAKLKALGLAEKTDNKEDEPIEINLPGSAGFSSFKNSLQEYLDKARLPLATYTIKRKKPDGTENEFLFKAKKMKKDELLKKMEDDKGCKFICTLEFDGNTISTTVPMPTDKDACQRAAFTALKFLKYIPPNAPFEEEVYKGKKGGGNVILESAFTESGAPVAMAPVAVPVAPVAAPAPLSAPMEFGWEPRQQVIT